MRRSLSTLTLLPALALGLCACAGPFGTLPGPSTSTPPPQAEKLSPSMYALRLAPDGCGVIRTTRQPEPRNLGWSVRDPQGFEVLQRNAHGEDRYRFYQPGRYTVVLTAFDGQGYAPVSNRVSVAC
jgi:hypothetical protein